MRVGIIALQHESNTFLPMPTTFAQFRAGNLLTGEAIRGEFGPSHHEVGGFFAGLEQAGIEPVPIFLAWALPGGAIPAETMETLLEMLLGELRQAGSLDGLLVAPHGAAVGETQRDLDGYWLTRLRETIGDDMPMIGTLDAHANLSQRMIDACNALVAYRSNPHLDQRQVGMQAADLMARTLRGEIRPVHAASFPPVAINIERQLTSGSPCKEMYAVADAQLTRPGILSNSILLGFPYADVAEMGSSFIVVTDGDVQAAQQAADELSGYLIANRDDFVGELLSIDGALSQAAESPGPVCLLDMGDNVGGGSPGDGTLLLHALHERGVPRSFVCLYDPDSVAAADAAGPGSTVTLALGGKVDDKHGARLKTSVTVQSMHEGKFSESEPRHGGKTNYDMGRTAVVETAAGQTIMLTAKRMVPFSLAQLTSCGLDPSGFDILVAKGVHAPVAAYAPVCPTLIRVNTPGVTMADMSQLEYQHRRRPLFPFEGGLLG